MSGITGFISNDNLDNIRVIKAMTHAISHRNPDSGRIWCSEDHNVVLGQCDQSMISACERYVIMFNGNLYNTASLKLELKSLNHEFLGSSNAEIILASIVRWGLQEALKRFNGAFVFALWDRKLQCLHLVRDRAGMKPLYYGWSNNVFLFGSELKALRAYPKFHAEIDRDVLVLYLQENQIPAPYSIYQGIYKLFPGAILTVEKKRFEVRVTPTYYLPYSDEMSQPEINVSITEAINHLEGLLLDSIRLRTDVNVGTGVFLSGGIDSSLIAALLQKQSTEPIKTFSIGFHEREYDETDFARKVANYLQTQHIEFYVSAKDALDVISKLPLIYDEPFGNSSQIPTYFACQLAKNSVGLSGDGADPYFFEDYIYAKKVNTIWNIIKFIPIFARKGIKFGVKSIPDICWDSFFDILKIVLPNRFSELLIAEKLYKFVELLSSNKIDILYHRRLKCSVADKIVLGTGIKKKLYLQDLWINGDNSFISHMVMFIVKRRLPDGDFIKWDRAGKAANLEVRMPFMDHKVTEFAGQLPVSMKFYENQGKWILKQILYRYLPKELVERPKKGFGCPVAIWLKGPLKDWAESLLSEDRLRKDGYFNPKIVRRKWIEYLSGKRDWKADLWGILMFQAWLDEYG